MTARYVAALDQGTTSTPLRALRRARAARSRAPSTSTARSRRARAGSSTTPTSCSRARARASTRPSRRPARAPATSRRSASPTSARRSCCGSARAGARSRTRSSGRTRAAPSAWPRSARSTASARRPGLPLATYFSGPKLSWLLDELPGARARAEAGELAAGTIDSWLAWHLAGVHVTDATNASRTLLMDLRTLDWDDGLLDAIGVPRALLAAIGPSSGVVGEIGGMPLAALLGDQQAALFGQCCFAAGRGQVHLRHRQLPRCSTRASAPSPSSHGLITGVAYRLGDGPPAYMLEGAVAVTGALVQWLRDNLGLIASGGRGRGARGERARQRRLRDRAGVLGPLRAALAPGRARRDLRADAVPHEGAPRARRARGDGLRDARARRGDGRGRRRRAAGAARRRRHDRERACCCRSRPTCSACRSCGRPRPRRRRSAPPTRPGSRSASGARWTSCAASSAASARGGRARAPSERERGYARLERGRRALARLALRQSSRVYREPAPAGNATQEEGGWTTVNASSWPSSSARSR